MFYKSTINYSSVNMLSRSLHKLFSVLRVLILFQLTLSSYSFCSNDMKGRPTTGENWVGTWSTAPQLVEPGNNPPNPGLSNNTLRQIVHVSLGGDSLRMRFSNEFSTSPVTLNEVHIAVSNGGGTIDPNTNKILHFNGNTEITMEPGVAITSDPFEFVLQPLSDIAITIYFGNTSPDVTGHPGSRTTSYLLTGNEVSTVDFSSAVKTDHWYIINTIDVLAPDSAAAVVVLGNSITDGRGSGTNKQNRWPDELARRLQENFDTQYVAVLNQGIGGNCVLRACLGPSAKNRFNRDVIGQNGVKWLIILEGINDIGQAWGDQGSAQVAQDLIAAYEEMIESAHANGIRVYGATLLPFGNSFYYTEDHETARQTVNEWIRNGGHFDAVIDLDEALRDPDNPLILRSEADTGDHLHPNETGHRMMAEAVDLNLFTVINLFGDDVPLVYDVENTGANCTPPPLPAFADLPVINPLTDPFEWSDRSGRSTRFEDWQCRRAEIKAEIEHYEIGKKPVRPGDITASYTGDTLTVNVTVNGNTLQLISAVTLPSGDGPFPAVIGMGGGTGSLPPDIFTSRDIATIAFNFGQVMAWEQIRGSEPINKLYPDLTYMGAYSAWSWGVSRLIDGLELVSENLPIDLKHLAITGCSFAGKMALFAGAFDERIALTIAQESGGGGAAAWRVSETLGNVETLGATSHVWFIEDMFKFSNAVSKLPYDHHELMAMVAPRALFVLGNPDYEWLADESGHVGSKAAQEVWNALEVPDRFGFSIVGGHGHCQLPNSQRPEVTAFVEKFLLGNTSANTDISTSPYNTNLAPWINWATPTLSNGTSFFGRASLVYPTDLQTGLDTSITLIWNKVIDAEKYIIQLSIDPTFNNITKSDSTITDTVITFNDLLKGKKYYWRVQVINSAGSSGPWSEVWNFTTFISLPAIPQLISVTPYPNRSDYVTLMWNSAQYADKYSIQLFKFDTFTIFVTTASSTDTIKVFSNISEGQKYYWQVQARNATGTSEWSDVSDFTIILAPTDLDLRRSGLTEITLTWDDNSTVEDGYVIERKQSPQTSFASLDTLKGSGDEYVDKNVEQAQPYTYRIKAYKDSAESDYSNEASLILVGVNEEEEMPDEYSLGQNYPNPFNPATKIKYSVPEFSFISLKVFNLLGEEIATLYEGMRNAGNYTVTFSGSKLTSGVYIYQLSSDNYSATKKLLLLN